MTIHVETHRPDGQPKTMAEMVAELDTKTAEHLEGVCRFPVPYCTLFWTEDDWTRYIANTCPCAKHRAVRAK